MLGSTELRALADAHDYPGIARALVEHELARGVYDLDALRVDPADEINAVGEVDVHLAFLPDDRCPVAGYYDHDSRPPRIVLHPSSTAARDRFTVLHELGHHLQRTVAAWADVWCLLPRAEGEGLNEAVADAFASEVLIPDRTIDLSASDVTARALCTAFNQITTVSRSALAHHALRGAAPGDDVTVVVCDLAGVVVFARAVGRLWAPARDGQQPSLRSLVNIALDNEGRATGALEPGLVSASGNIQDDLVADLAIDSSGRYAFAVIRPASRYAPPSWVDTTQECTNPACGETFKQAASPSTCQRCGDRRSPHCGSCSCSVDVPSTCPRCRLAYSAAERDDPARHECW